MTEVSCHDDAVTNSDNARLELFRDEDYHILSKVKHALKNEGNDFLGQKLIDVRTLTEETDLWYTLGLFTLPVLQSGGGYHGYGCHSDDFATSALIAALLLFTAFVSSWM